MFSVNPDYDMPLPGENVENLWPAEIYVGKLPDFKINREALCAPCGRESERH